MEKIRTRLVGMFSCKANLTSKCLKKGKPRIQRDSGAGASLAATLYRRQSRGAQLASQAKEMGKVIACVRGQSNIGTRGGCHPLACSTLDVLLMQDASCASNLAGMWYVRSARGLVHAPRENGDCRRLRLVCGHRASRVRVDGIERPACCGQDAAQEAWGA